MEIKNPAYGTTPFEIAIDPLALLLSRGLNTRN